MLVLAILISLMISISFKPATLVAEDVIPSPCLHLESDKDCAIRLAGVYAAKYKVSKAKVIGVIGCESDQFNPEAQSNLKYKKNNRWKQPTGSREQSFGLVQIHLPDHPEITMEQATDIEFSIEFLAKSISEGKGGMWTCYRKLYA